MTHVVLRIWRKVEPSSGTGCWIFTGFLSPDGYGYVQDSGNGRRGMKTAHSVMYREIFGQVPDGLQLDHLCRIRACCNPWHLEPVEARENVVRGASLVAVNAAKTSCVRGHEFSEANTIRRLRAGRRHPSRECRTCDHDRKTRQVPA